VPSGYPVSRSVKRELFDRVCCGASVAQAAAAVGVSRVTGAEWWRDAGGMTLATGRSGGIADCVEFSDPGGPGYRLSLQERLEIMRGRDAGLSYAEIGRLIKRDRSVVFREVQRNSNADGDYHAMLAHRRAAHKARRPKAFKLRDHPLCSAIEDWMDDGWSPKLIAEVLARDHPDDKL
jgi:transposase, IS30 family